MDRHQRVFATIVLAWALLGTVGCAAPEYNEYKRQAGYEFEVPEFPDSLLGEFVVTDYVEYRGGLEPENWAKQQVGTEVVLSAGKCSGLGMTPIKNPKYTLAIYAPEPDGNVATGKRRGLVEFCGGPNEDKRIVSVVLETANADFEVIDCDTLWCGVCNWLFQLKRKGTEGHFVPLKNPEDAK